MKRIYLAGASSELLVCEHWMSRLRRSGFTITQDWCSSLREEMARDRTDLDLAIHERIRYANSDLDGIKYADVFWLLAPAGMSTGCWVELGYALSTSVGNAPGFKPWIVVSGEGQERCIFSALAFRRFAAHELAFKWLAPSDPG